MTAEKFIAEHYAQGTHTIYFSDLPYMLKKYAKIRQLESLEAFKADAIYCNGSGVKDMKIENYLDVKLR